MQATPWTLGTRVRLQAQVRTSILHTGRTLVRSHLKDKPLQWPHSTLLEGKGIPAAPKIALMTIIINRVSSCNPHSNNSGR